MLNHLRAHKLPMTGRDGERGFTLLEVLVSLVIMAIIIVPLAMGLGMSFKVTEQTDANLTASTNRLIISSYWSKDVASVDATGVGTGTVQVCRGAGWSASHWAMCMAFEAAARRRM